MKIALVGPELEENLALRYIHSSVSRAGHEAAIFDFHAPEQVPALAAEIAQWRPEVVGLSMVFTSRAGEFVALAAALRAAGCAGHITAGGHFASLNADPLLRDAPAIDSVLHGEGEEAVADLADKLPDCRRVRGMTYRRPDGGIASTPPRPPTDDLDSRPWPTRPASFHDYFGLPVAPVLAGRGCYANCAFCSINAWHRKVGGKRFRQRSVEDLTAEMAHLYHDRGVRIFNFHDDNFFPRGRAARLGRFRALRDRLEALDVRRIGIQVKSRPDTVEGEGIALLKDIGLFRVFLGVENAAVAGLKALNRGVARQQNDRAIETLRAADVHVTFNLLIFRPDCSLADLADNIDFIRRHAACPLNFCRVEVYAGTAIERRLRDAGRLEGDYFGYTYRIADPRCQLAYELFHDVFTPRNFFEDGMNHQAMALDYNLHVLKRFFPQRVSADLVRRCDEFIRALNRSNADLLEEVCRLAASPAGAAAPAGVADFVDSLRRRRAEFDAAAAGPAETILNQIGAAASARSRAAKGGLARAATAAAATLMVATLAAGRPPGTEPCEPAPIRPPVGPKAKGPYVVLFGVSPSGPVKLDLATTRPATGPATQPASAPASQPTTAPASQPAAVKPCTPAQARRIRAHLQQHYAAAVRQLANTYLTSPKQKVRIRMTLSAEGRPVIFRIAPAGKENEPLVRALRKHVLTWRISGLSRPVSCTVGLIFIPASLLKPPPPPGGWERTEPVHRRPGWEQTELVPRPPPPK